MPYSRAGFGCLLLLACVLGSNAEGAQGRLELPLGLDERAVSVPEDNPVTPDKIALGKQFFWDKRWSKSGAVACVTCHLPEHGWSDPRQFPVNFAGRQLARHSGTIVNRLFSDRQGWAGQRASLEDFAGKDFNMAVDHLAAIPAYQRQFRQVFGTDLNLDGVAKAVAAYVRTIVSGNAPYDRFRAADTGALSPAARRGLTLFGGKARCIRCHDGFNFTDEGYHNLGVGMDRENPDLGRYDVTKREVNKGAFKTPTLRDVARRGPYMHDGSMRTLRAVVAFYDRGGIPNPWLSPEIVSLGLTPEEREDLVAFLEALTGEISRGIGMPPVLP